MGQSHRAPTPSYIRTYPDVPAYVAKLVNNGQPPDSIEVFRPAKMKTRVTVEFD